MTSNRQRLWILGLWTLVLCAAAWLLPRPASDDEEYWKWFIFGALAFGLRWFLDWLVVLLIALSLERRRGRPRLWILGVWTLIAFGAVWLEVIRPVMSFYPSREYREWLRVSLHLLAFPWLFGLLIALWVALWVEKQITTRPLSMQLDPQNTEHD